MERERKKEKEGQRQRGPHLYPWPSWHLTKFYHSKPQHGIRIHFKLFRDFPGGTVVKNLPVNAGDMGSSPGPGRSHMPRSK